jgi:hypothetical protein
MKAVSDGTGSGSCSVAVFGNSRGSAVTVLEGHELETKTPRQLLSLADHTA